MQYCTELAVGSLLVYPPHGSAASGQARAFIRYRIKQARNRAIEMTIDRLVSLLPGSVLEELLDGSRTLVPVPGHAPLTKDALWVPRLICQTMIIAGLGTTVAPCVTRLRVVVQQSTRSTAGERLSPAEHADTMSVDGVLELGSKVLLVDDVVTRGSTLVAAASLILHHAPGLDVKAFAIGRVVQEPLAEVGDMLAPTMETILCDEAGTSPVRRGTR